LPPSFILPVVFIHAGGDHGDASSRKLGAAGDAGDAAKTRSARRIIGTTWRAVRSIEKCFSSKSSATSAHAQLPRLKSQLLMCVRPKT